MPFSSGGYLLSKVAKPFHPPFFSSHGVKSHRFVTVKDHTSPNRWPSLSDVCTLQCRECVLKYRRLTLATSSGGVDKLVAF